MSAWEILSAVTCLFLGYWIVSAVLERKRDKPGSGGEKSGARENAPVGEQDRADRGGGQGGGPPADST